MPTTWGDLTDEHEGLEVTFTRETDRAPVEDPAVPVTGVLVAAGHMGGVDDDGVQRLARVVAIPLEGFDEPVERAIELRADAPVTVGS